MFQHRFRPTLLPLTRSMFNGPDLTRVPARRPATLLRVASFSAPESGHGEATAAAEAAAAATETSIASRHALDREEERRGGDTRFVGNRGSSEPEILTAGAKEFNSAQPALQAPALLDDGEPGGGGNCCRSFSSSSASSSLLLACIMSQ